MAEQSTKPYLIRAIYEWCIDCGFTPYLSVKVNRYTRVPQEYVKDGEIVLNVSPEASRNLVMKNDVIQFSARFGGVSREISIPIDSVQGVFAKENGQGILFEVDSEEDLDEEELNDAALSDLEGPPVTKGKPNLRIVK